MNWLIAESSEPAVPLVRNKHTLNTDLISEVTG
jgi:hypothetical protein